MATKKSTALPGVMAGSTVGTGGTKAPAKTSLPGLTGGVPTTSAKSTSTTVKKPVTKPTTAPKPKTKTDVNVNETPAGSPGTAWVWNGTQWVRPAMPSDGKTYTWDDMKGWTYDPAADKDPEYDALIAGLKVYNIDTLIPTMEKIRRDNPGITSDGMLTLLRNDTRYNKAYLERFAGNAALNKAGKPMLSEAEYLSNEAAYAKTFNSYDLGRFANTAQYTKLIANQTSPDEAASRVALGYDRLLKGNTNTLSTFRKFNPSITASDIIAVMLDDTQLPILERKVVAAEIGGAAVTQGLNAELLAMSAQSKAYSNIKSDTIGVEAIQATGANEASAKAGYEVIAQELPTMEKLSSYYNASLEAYTQSEAEKEQFQGLASAKRKKEALLAREAATWSGSSGVTRNALGGTSYQGSF